MDKSSPLIPQKSQLKRRTSTQETFLIEDDDNPPAVKKIKSEDQTVNNNKDVNEVSKKRKSQEITPPSKVSKVNNNAPAQKNKESVDDIDNIDDNNTSEEFTKANRKRLKAARDKYKTKIDIDLRGFNFKQKQFIKMCLYGKNVLCLGRAGTGKSYAIRHLVQLLNKKGLVVHVTAMTGVAANNLCCGASTLHWWAGLGKVRKVLQLI
jgi:DNA-nicking Smr family endonuclease